MNLRLWLCGWLILVAMSGCKKAAKEVESATGDDVMRVLIEAGKEENRDEIPFVSIYVIGQGDVTDPYSKPRVILAVWRDGKAIYSKDRIQGGTPYFQTTVTQERIHELFAVLDKSGEFRGTRFEYRSGGFASIDTILHVHDGDKLLHLETCHEIEEQNPDAIATDDTVFYLDGTDREKIIRQWSGQYKKFRKTWSMARNEIDKLIQPKETDPEVGDIQFTTERFGI
jgi:hypothetical protein